MASPMASRVGHALGEPIGVVRTNQVGLDFEDAEAIAAAPRATAAAHEALAMDRLEGSDGRVHVAMEGLDVHDAVRQASFDP